MARILKRPMFNRGGSSNQGIMDGLVDRTGLAEGTPKFDTGKMKEDAGNILSKISKFTPGGIIGRGIASMTKGNEAEIVKAIQKMLAVTPVGQVGEAIRILANRYRIDPAVVERIAKSQMTDANIQTDPSGSADEGFPSRPEFESSAEDTSIMPRTNRFDEEAFVPNLRDLKERFQDRVTRPDYRDEGFPESGPLEKGGGDGGELMPLPFPYERDDIERMPLPYPYDRDPNFFMEPFRPGDGGDPERGPFRPGDGGDFEYLNQGGRVDRRQYELGAFGERAKQTSDDVYGFMKDLVPPPETRLPLGQLGANLLSGKGFRDSAVDAYGSFVTADDERQNYDRELKMKAAGVGIEDAVAMRSKKKGEKEIVEGFLNNYWDPLISAEQDPIVKADLERQKAQAVYKTIVLGKDISDEYKILGNAAAFSEAQNLADDELKNTINPTTDQNWTDEDPGYSQILQKRISFYLAQLSRSFEPELKSEGGRVGKQLGGIMDENMPPVAETTNEINISYDQLRDRLPPEIGDNIVLLLSQSYEALADFSEIQTQANVNEFNIKYNVELSLPQQQEV